jgi:hypothetical protein
MRQLDPPDWSYFRAAFGVIAFGVAGVWLMRGYPEAGYALVFLGTLLLLFSLRPTFRSLFKPRKIPKGLRLEGETLVKPIDGLEAIQFVLLSTSGDLRGRAIQITWTGPVNAVNGVARGGIPEVRVDRRGLGADSAKLIFKGDYKDPVTKITGVALSRSAVNILQVKWIKP